MTRRVHVLGTGGTIAGAQPDPGHHGYTPGAYGIDWLRLALRLNEFLDAPATDAVLITHGTDTLEETSHFLGLVTPGDNPTDLPTSTTAWPLRQARGPPGAARFSVSGLDDLPRVDILYAHAGMSLDLIEAALDNGARGIVVAGVGAGNMSARVVERLAAAVAAGDLNPAKSRVLLRPALTETNELQRIQARFEQC